ncbi:MAG: CopG family transcriptional regulator [Deltaproteobacteria bacterium]|nr:CopG family transcriptional regulator [Deltaproteobacteria bacterium]
MINVTLKIDDDVANWARVFAAKRNVSLSRLLSEMLRDRMAREDEYQLAMKSYLARAPSELGEVVG